MTTDGAGSDPGAADRPNRWARRTGLGVALVTLLSGRFEADANRWTLNAGASIAPGDGGPLATGGTGRDSHALGLTAGSSATSRAFCFRAGLVNLPFFAKPLSDDSQVTVRLALSNLGSGASVAYTSTFAPGSLGRSGAWKPAQVVWVTTSGEQARLGADESQWELAVTFAATGGGVRIDDVVFGPFRSA